MRESPCPSRGRCIRSCSARSRVKCHPGRTRPNSERSHPAPVPWCPRGGSWASFLLSSRNSKTRTISKVGMGVAPSARNSSTGAASASHRVTAETARPPARPHPPPPAASQRVPGRRLGHGLLVCLFSSSASAFLRPNAAGEERPRWVDVAPQWDRAASVAPSPGPHLKRARGRVCHARWTCMLCFQTAAQLARR